MTWPKQTEGMFDDRSGYVHTSSNKKLSADVGAGRTYKKDTDEKPKQPPFQQIRMDTNSKLEKLTVEQLHKMIPLRFKSGINQGFVDELNRLLDESEDKQVIRDNFISWITVLGSSKFKMQTYIEAVKYVSYKMMGDTNIMSYAKAMPTRYQQLVERGKTIDEINAYVGMFNQNKVVVEIIKRTLVPIWVINSDILQEAINTQAELMRSARSETVRMKAASNLIDH